MSETNSRIRLYAYPTSPYAQKVGCYLKYKKLDYELMGVNPMNNAAIRFTGQRRVPVLQIGDEWRLESSELGLWLEELYPENPIMPADESLKAEILAIDHWVSESLIPTNFRRAVEWENPVYAIRNGWKLARAVHDATPLPWYARALWPFAVRRAPFIVHMVRGLDLTESIADRITRLQREFVAHLKDGPFFAGQSKPTLADLSAYPIIVAPHLMGMKNGSSMLDSPAVASWSRRVQSFLPDNPLLIPDRLLERTKV
ncbi:glutathione S-transferase family protein [Proteobacteria bacterium 005FR1]|nr:glutathione S-transferase family protein [Proteobacteria bacterium 005FR1]